MSKRTLLRGAILFGGDILVKAQSDMAAMLGPRIRKLRRRQELTLQELGAASGVSVGYLSQVERGNATPTLGTLSQIAAALQVGVDHFITAPRAADNLTRQGKRETFSISGSSIIYEQLAAEMPGYEITSFILNVPPGYSSEQISHEGEEFIYILDGAIEQIVDHKTYVMQQGDSLHYLGTCPHSWSNNSKEMARILWVGRMQYERSGSPINANVPGVSRAKEGHGSA